MLRAELRCTSPEAEKFVKIVLKKLQQCFYKYVQGRINLKFSLLGTVEFRLPGSA